MSTREMQLATKRRTFSIREKDFLKASANFVFGYTSEQAAP